MVFESGSARRGSLLIVVLLIGAVGTPTAAGDDPIFVRWLVPDDPGDETIREYWERAENSELAAPELVDLGTMLFYRGWPKDAVKMYRRALKLDSNLFEAWFRIGLVEHSQGELDNARQAYRRCLKQQVGHGWCNFYLGLLEEQMGHGSNAMLYYERALESAPELADPMVNPEVLNSRLILGANLYSYDQRSFVDALPIEYLEPEKVGQIEQKYEPPAPPDIPQSTPLEQEPVSSTINQAEEMTTADSVPAPTPVPKAPPRSIPARRAPTRSTTPYGTALPPVTDQQDQNVPQAAPPVGSVSNEASLAPGGLISRWLVEALV